jgi:MFS family permease
MIAPPKRTLRGETSAEPNLGLSHDVKAWYGLVIAAVLVNATFETMLLPALPLIRAGLSLTPAQVGLLYAAYPLAAAVSLPIVGKLSDILGARRLIAAALLMLTVGTMLPALAPSWLALLVGQGLQGVGTALVPLGIALLGETRGETGGVRSGSLITAAAASTALGLLLAGALLSVVGYRALFCAAFGLNACLLLLAGWMSRRSSHVPQHGGGTVDWLGALLLGSALVALLMTLSAITQGGGLKSAALGASSLLLLALFCVRSISSADPLLDLRLLATPAINRVAVIQLFSGFGANALLVAVPLIVQAGASGLDVGRGAAQGGLALAPFGVASIFGPMIVAPVRARWGQGAVMMAGALAVMAAPLILMATRDMGAVALAAGCLGLGVGLLLTQSFDLVGTTVPIARVASSSSLMFVLKMVGSAFGSQISLAVLGARPSDAAIVQASGLSALALAMSAIAALGILRIGRPRR